MKGGAASFSFALGNTCITYFFEFFGFLGELKKLFVGVLLISVNVDRKQL